MLNFSHIIVYSKNLYKQILPSGVLAALSSLLLRALGFRGFKGVRFSGPSLTAPLSFGSSMWPMLFFLFCSAILCAWSTALRAELRRAAVVRVCRRLFWRGLINTERLEFRALVRGEFICGSAAMVWRLLICIRPIALARGEMLEAAKKGKIPQGKKIFITRTSDIIE